MKVASMTRDREDTNEVYRQEVLTKRISKQLTWYYASPQRWQEGVHLIWYTSVKSRRDTLFMDSRNNVQY